MRPVSVRVGHAMKNEFDGKNVAVIGMARSGLSCARALRKLGSNIYLYDARPAEELRVEIAAAEALGIKTRPNGMPVNYKSMDLLVTSPGVRKSAPVLREAVAAGVEVIGEIEAAFRMTRAPILAITGTNGKTTTAALLGEIVRAAGYKTYVAGNIAAGDLAMPLTEAASEAEDNAVIVAEISSFQLEWISHFRPRVAALLNITPDHGDRQSWDEYTAAKWRIFENQKPGDFAIVHSSLAQEARERGVRSTIIEFGGPELTAQLSAIVMPSEILLPGRHNVENVLAAAAMATAFGIDIEPIRQVARIFPGVVHRLEYIATIDHIKYINNSMCTNVAAFEASLAAVPERKVVIAGGVFKGDDLAPLANSLLTNRVRSLVLIGQSSKEIAEAARAAGYNKIHLAEDIEAAVAQAHAVAEPGDAVILAPACASFDMFKDFEERGNRFKDAVRGAP